MHPSAHPILVFDLDGTLVDTAPDLWRATNHVMHHLDRRDLSLDEVRHCVGHGARRLIALGLGLTGGQDNIDIDAALPRFLSFYADHIAVESLPYPGVIATLTALQGRGFTLAVCTNKPEGLARHLLEELEMLPFFAAVIGGDSLPVRKPSPEPLQEAIRLAGGSKGWMIGDSESDIGAGINAGLPTVAVTYGYGAEDDLLAQATHHISDFAALLTLDLIHAI